MSTSRSFVLVASALLAAACGSTPEKPESGPQTAATPQPENGAAAQTPQQTAAAEEAAQKVTDATNQVEMARRRLERAQMDLDQQKSDGAAAVAKATTERDQAQKELAHFDAVDMPQRLDKATLDLKDSTDSMTEQEEEMQQLELMYKNDDLADKTKEIVLARGKRRLERAKQRLALAQKDFDDLKKVQLPKEREKLALALKDKELDLARASFGEKTGGMDKETAVLAAQQELEKVGRELEKAKKAVAFAPGGGGPESSVASFLFASRL